MFKRITAQFNTIIMIMAKFGVPIINIEKVSGSFMHKYNIIYLSLGFPLLVIVPFNFALDW